MLSSVQQLDFAKIDLAYYQKKLCLVLREWDTAKHQLCFCTRRADQTNSTICFRQLLTRTHMSGTTLSIFHLSFLKQIKSILSLSKKNSICVSKYLKTKKVVDRTQSFKCKFVIHIWHNLFNQRSWAPSNKYIINIIQQEYYLTFSMQDEQRSIRNHILKFQKSHS